MKDDLIAVFAPVLGLELAEALIEFRKVKKPALTVYAAKLLVKEYLKTGDPVAAAEMQILRGWRGMKASWYFKEIANDQRQNSRSFIDAARELSTDVSGNWPHAGVVQSIRRQ